MYRCWRRHREYQIDKIYSSTDSATSLEQGADSVNERLERTAYHEAGHAVMCRLGGSREIVDVTIKSDDNLGAIQYLPRHWVSDHEREEIMNPDVWAELWRDAKRGCAGEQAQILRFGHADGEVDQNRDYSVFLQIICTQQEREQIIQEVEALLKDNWAKVDAVAEALLERTTLSGQEVKEIIANKN